VAHFVMSFTVRNPQCCVMCRQVWLLSALLSCMQFNLQLP